MKFSDCDTEWKMNNQTQPLQFVHFPRKRYQLCYRRKMCRGVCVCVLIAFQDGLFLPEIAALYPWLPPPWICQCSKRRGRNMMRALHPTIKGPSPLNLLHCFCNGIWHPNQRERTDSDGEERWKQKKPGRVEEEWKELEKRKSPVTTCLLTRRQRKFRPFLNGKN